MKKIRELYLAASRLALLFEMIREWEPASLSTVSAGRFTIHSYLWKINTESIHVQSVQEAGEALAKT